MVVPPKNFGSRTAYGYEYITHIRFDDIRSTAFTQRPFEHPDTSSSVHVFSRRVRLWQSVSTVLLLQSVSTVRIVYFLRKLLSPLLCTLRCLPELLYGMCSALCLHCAFGPLVGVFCNQHCKKKVVVVHKCPANSSSTSFSLFTIVLSKFNQNKKL